MQATVGPVLRPGEGESVGWFGLGVRFMIDGAATGGRFSLVEHPLAPRSLGAPVHTHRNEDEFSYILEGRIGIQVGDDVLEATPGDLVFKPRGTPHAFWNATDEPARLLEIISPGGLEDYFRQLAPLLAAPDPDLPAVGALAARFALDLDPSSIPVLAQRYGLKVG